MLVREHAVDPTGHEEASGAHSCTANQLRRRVHPKFVVQLQWACAALLKMHVRQYLSCD